jgi:hypothetical protein
LSSGSSPASTSIPLSNIKNNTKHLLRLIPLYIYNDKEKQIEELEMKLMLERNLKKDLLTEKNNLEKVIEELYIYIYIYANTLKQVKLHENMQLLNMQQLINAI